MSKVKPNGIVRIFRVFVWRDGGFWKEPSYVQARSSAHARAMLYRDAGAEVAQKSCVTAIANAGIDGGKP